jgi:hypothetical protein
MVSQRTLEGVDWSGPGVQGALQSSLPGHLGWAPAQTNNRNAGAGEILLFRCLCLSVEGPAAANFNWLVFERG